MLARTLRLLLLTAALLLTQLGGLLHGLSHQIQDQDRPHTPCQLCAAYAALDHGAVGQTPPPLAVQTFIPGAPVADSGSAPRPCLPYRSRAPPALV